MRRVAAFVALIVCSSTLVGLPTAAQAATGLSVASGTLAVETPSGKRVVYVPARCLGTKTCSGKVSLQGSGAAPVAYSMKAKKSGYLTVPATSFRPTGVVGGTGETSGTTIATKLVVAPKGRSSFVKNMTLEKRIASARIVGQVRGPGVSSLRNLKISWWTVSGLRSSRDRSVDVGSDGTVVLGSWRLGRNNASGAPVRLSVSATVDGSEQEWFFRGTSGVSDGGGGWIRDGSTVRARKTSDFVANFDYGTVQGRLTGGSTADREDADVRVVAPPASYPSRASDRRGLDVPYCANEFGRTSADANGAYAVRFVPRPTGTKARYMVDFEPATSKRGAVIVRGQRVVDSCQAAIGYKRDFSRLLAFPTGSQVLEVGSVGLAADVQTLTVNGNVLRGGTTSDRWTSLREYSAGRKILESPVVAAGVANSKGDKSFGVRPGKYWLEVGRRTSCSAWYPSIYPNNYLYHKGGERGNERWKTVSGKNPEYPKSVRMGYKPRNPPKGYKGWMYRDVCKAIGAGRYTLVTVGSSDRTVNVSNPRGGTVSGRVTRSGGKSNKEMLVTVYSTDGKKVLRSAYTGKSGGFVIRGLASGSYRIVVNGDSWRGLSRSWTGKKSVKAKAGRNVSAGTLRFKG